MRGHGVHQSSCPEYMTLLNPKVSGILDSSSTTTLLVWRHTTVRRLECRVVLACNLRLRHELLALLDVLLEIGQAGRQQLLFLSRELTNGVDLLNTVGLYATQQLVGFQESLKIQLTPSSTLEEKKSMPWSAKRELLTKVGVVTPFSPLSARRRSPVKRAPA